MGPGKLMESKRRPVILLDVDQVCADLHTVWLEAYNEEYGDSLQMYDIRSWDIHKYVKPECGQRIYEYLEKPGLYDTVRPVPMAKEGVSILHSWGLRTVYLTSAGAQAAMEKMQWLGRHGFLKTRNGGHPGRDIVIANDKSLVHGYALVDDHVGNLETSPAFLRILFSQPHNEGTGWRPRVSGWPSLIAYLSRHFNKPLHDKLNGTA